MILVKHDACSSACILDPSRVPSRCTLNSIAVAPSLHGISPMCPSTVQCGFPAVLEVPSSTSVLLAQQAEKLEEAVEDMLHLPHYHLQQGAGSTQVCIPAA